MVRRQFPGLRKRQDAQAGTGFHHPASGEVQEADKVSWSNAMLEGPNNIWMQPWVGNNYPTRRLLIVGESAYDDPANNYCVNPRTNIDIIGEEVEVTLASIHKSQKQVARIVCDAATPNYTAFW